MSGETYVYEASIELLKDDDGDLVIHLELDGNDYYYDPSVLAKLHALIGMALEAVGVEPGGYDA